MFKENKKIDPGSLEASSIDDLLNNYLDPKRATDNALAEKQLNNQAENNPFLRKIRTAKKNLGSEQLPISQKLLLPPPPPPPPPPTSLLRLAAEKAAAAQKKSNQNVQLASAATAKEAVIEAEAENVKNSKGKSELNTVATQEEKKAAKRAKKGSKAEAEAAAAAAQAADKENLRSNGQVLTLNGTTSTNSTTNNDSTTSTAITSNV